jgi:hypothetical protein
LIPSLGINPACPGIDGQAASSPGWAAALNLGIYNRLINIYLSIKADMGYRIS